MGEFYAAEAKMIRSAVDLTFAERARGVARAVLLVAKKGFSFTYHGKLLNLIIPQAKDSNL